MVGGKNDLIVALCQPFEQVGHDRMAEPTLRNATVSTLIISQLSHHFRFGSCMRQHVNKVDNHHVKVVFVQAIILLQELFSANRIVYFVITELVMTSISLNLCAYKGFFI